MKLQDKLDAIRTEFAESASVEVIKIMHRVNEDLKHSGILGKVLKVGDQVPDFTLADTTGNAIPLSSYLEKGPLVLTFFRGQW
ncbi:thioredoxin domain-containing protein [Desulfotalea psychrophila]|uniref:Uncharacterized protein n=1 Tax=Desulfotalea psychrophila (strain LSv54 / DSM 12343) TaxID=177439 RepID=Q6AJP1_DESPS|nr:hypothetical protein DP2710 [Desulfotalea psychrophila LSv54]